MELYMKSRPAAYLGKRECTPKGCLFGQQWAFAFLFMPQCINFVNIKK